LGRLPRSEVPPIPADLHPSRNVVTSDSRSHCQSNRANQREEHTLNRLIDEDFDLSVFEAR
jgi:hypothetical protein